MTRTKAIAYLRVSTETQAEEGVSLAAQEQRVLAYGHAFDIEIVAVVRDAGASAKDLGRPGLERAFALLDDGTANAIIVAKLDRLTRSVKDLSMLLERYFTAGGAALISVSENIDTSSAAGRLVLNVLVSVGQWEREAIAERTREALRHLKHRGVRMGAPGLGWRYSDAVDEDGRHVVELVDEEAQAVNRICALRRDGMSMRAIAATLAAEGWRTKHGGRWHPATVQRVLRRAG